MIDVEKLKVNEFPKIHKRLDLAGFADFMRSQDVDEADAVAVERALEGNYLNVWLNHNQEFTDAWLDWQVQVKEGQEIVAQLKSAGLQKEADAGLIAELTTQLNAQTAYTLALGRGAEAMLLGCEPDDIDAINELSAELYQWINRTAWEFVGEYRSGRKKGAAR